MADGQETGHWYDKDGNSQYTIVGANGKERNTTLRDARKEGFVPSVTTVMNVAAKPSLENWKITQAINSAVTLRQEKDESMADFIRRCKKDSRKITEDAAERAPPPGRVRPERGPAPEGGRAPSHGAPAPATLSGFFPLARAGSPGGEGCAFGGGGGWCRCLRGGR